VALGASRIELAHLPRALRRAVPSLSMSPSPRELPRDAGPLDERREVELALEHARGNITHAARALGLTRHGLKKRMLRLGLRASVAERSSS
jgi:transcriptional regulator with GAF, ATPase, and Fis domain